MIRVRFKASDNLGLLLDTMCNAFGGVIFIAMLLAVLSQFAEVTSEGEFDPATLKEMENRHSQLASDLATLRLVEAQQSQVLAAMEATTAVYEQLEHVRQRNMDLTKVLDQLQQEDQQIAAIQKRLETVRKLKKDIEIAAKGEVRKLDLPRLVSSHKLTLFFIIKWNRLFPLRQTTSAQVHGPINTTEVAHNLKSASGGRTAHEFDPISGRGIPLDAPGWKGAQSVENILKHAPAAEYSLHFAVYPDSYSTLQTVRAFFSEKGYESNWYIMSREDEKLLLQTGGLGATPTIQK